MLLILPPLTQLNTPYPSITHLTGYLRNKGVKVQQIDLGIELIDKLLRKDIIRKIFDIAEGKKVSKHLKIIISNRCFYEQNVETVKKYLSGKDTSLATRLSNIDFWENMFRLPDEDELEWAFGTSGIVDRAKYLCSLFLKNICDVIETTVDEHFQLIRYAEKLCTYLTEFEIVEREIVKQDTIITNLMIEILDAEIREVSPMTIGISIPFPGNLLAGLKCAKYIREKYPYIKIIMGGGYVNTELRQISDAGIFKYVDYITYDDGELPVLRIINGGELLRTAYLKDGHVEFANMDSKENEKFSDLPAPTTEGLSMDKYMDFVDTTNPMHRLWSDGRWNKMILAHGCYWAKCAFCDTKLDYIGRFESCPVENIVDKMEKMINETGNTGFHFVDEAAPPAILRKLSEEIIKRNLVVSYWTNVRFDKTYTPELCYLMAKSGCIAVSGGLEVASPRVLKLINKGVTIESATECMKNLSEHGIMVHAYLMYGFPTQTENELFESLGIVRDLFSKGYIQSAFWHRYAMTCHSPSGCFPESVCARHVTEELNPFANNEIAFITENEPNWDKYSEGLNLATYNYMRQTGFDISLKKWFHFKC